MQLNTYLHFKGNCEAAFKFYEQCLGGKIIAMSTYGDSPAAGQTAPEFRGKIIHARLMVGETVLMGSDAPPGRDAAPQGFSLSIGVKTVEEAERIFKALSENGTVHMPMAESFFAVRFGMAVDRFGIPWMVICEKAA